AADNSLDNVLLNGVSKGIAAGGFAGYFGPFTVTGWAAGTNTIDFLWSNAGQDVNPGGFRVKWDATAQPILAKTTLPSNPVTAYFRQKFTYNGNPASAYRLLLNYIADDGAIFYLNGAELHRVRMTGSPTSTTLANSDVLYPKFSGAIEVPATALTTGENTLAVELHQSSAGNVDAFFLATLDLIETPPATTTSSTLTLNELAGANDATWFAELRNTGTGTVSLAGYTLSTSGGASYALTGSLAAGAVLSLDQTTLGWRPLDGDKLFLSTATIVADAQVVKNRAQARDTAGRWLTPSATTPGGANTFSVPDAIVINEIMYHHAPAYLATGTTESAEEWVELYNKSGSTVVLTGWKLSGGVSFDFAPGTQILPGAYLVLAKDAAALLAKFPGITVVGPLGGSPSHSDDSVVLDDANKNPVDEVHYFDGGRWDDRADGGGSSLELRNPGMDNSVPEAWAASDESGKAAWQTFTYTGTGAPPLGSNDPTLYNELVIGLLSQGEFLLDDVSVIEVSVGNRQCIQNGNFSSGTAAFWRNIGTHGSHGRTVVVDDPSLPGNKVLKVVATAATEHMHNHCETTLKSGGSYVAIQPGNNYTVSFRARWVSGSPRLNSRLYFNRLARQSILPIPTNTGTPGAQNSRFLANPGPTFSALAHSPVLPDANAPVTVSVKATDPQSVAGVSLKWKTDGALTFNNVAMTLTGDHFEGTIPAQFAGTLLQFYVEATDGSGAVSTFPATGVNSRAMIHWKDGIAPTTLGHGFRILLPTADANFLHDPTNVMSNDYLPCTVVYRESEVHYDAAVRLKSSERGRPADIRLGFAVTFDPMHLFRGTHGTVNLDRSAYGRGTPGSGFGQSDIVTWHFMNRAGGVPSMFNDLVYLIAPRSVHNGSAQLTMAEFNDIWCDSQFPDGAALPVFKYELIYYPTTTVGNSPEGLKLPSPDDVVGVEFGQTNSADKEAHRWNFLIGNARTTDDYSRIINLNNTYRLTGAAFNAAIPNAIDVDQWLRASAA
ncbi:MAG: lamin tail domain-containing protein, partial [Chthoniobacteraceae bacterium]